MDQLLAAGTNRGGSAVIEDRFLLPFQWDASEPRYQFLAVGAFDGGLEARTWPVRCLADDTVFPCHLCHRRAVLRRQRLEHGGSHDPLQPVEPVDIAGQQIVLGDAPEFGPVNPDDVVVGQVDKMGPTLGFSAAMPESRQSLKQRQHPARRCRGM
nr:hypothetical protein [Frankia sp. Cr1]